MSGEKIADSLSLEDARRVIDAAVAKAVEIGVPQDVAVVDTGGHLKAHVRMDNANIGSIYISINKAHTSIAFQCQTKDLTDITRVDQDLYGLNDAHGGRLVVFPGGIPLVRDGRIVGAIGVSTGTIEEDQTVAEAGAAAL
jgi:uncharacterized protein GlcG (DUF336 family)